MLKLVSIWRGQAGRRPIPGRTRHRRRARRPIVEGLEGRTLLTLDFAYSLGLGGTSLVAKTVQIDAAGDNLVAGYFSGTVDFDPGAAATNLTSHGGYDIYLAKYSPTGALLWAKDFGGSGNDMGNALTLDPAGNLYLAGQFSNSMALGGTTLTAAGGSDAFLAKLDPSGNVTWAAGDGGSGNDLATAVALDPAGNVVVAGQYSNSAQFGGTTLTSLGSYDVFVAKYTPAGGLSWARSQGGTSVDLVSSLATDDADNLFLSGSFMGTASFGGKTLVAGGGYDAYLAKLDPAGTGLWALRLGGSGLDMGQGVATDGAGNAYITGEFSGTVAVGGTSLSSLGQTDGYVVKVGPSGAVAWSESFGGTSNDEGMAIAVDPASGSATVGGQFMNTGNFGTTQLASIGQFDAFVAQLDPTGNFLWAKDAGGGGSDGVSALAMDAAGDVSGVGYYAGPAIFGGTTLGNIGAQNFFLTSLQDNAPPPSHGLSSVIGVGGSGILAKAVRLDAAGNSYVAGYFSGTVDFDPGAAATNLTSHGGYDIYLAKYSPTGALLWAKDFGGSGNDMGNALTLDPAGNLYLAGQFSNSMALGGTTLTAAGGSDAFLAKLDPSGNVTWAAGDGGSGNDLATAVALDPAGNVVVAGQYSNSAQFGGTTLTSLGSYDVFVAKYTPAGGLSWARSQGGTSVDLVSSLASDDAGNLFLTGSFMGTAGFGGTTLVAGGSYDAYLAKLNSAGTGLWALRLGGSGLDMGQGVATDAAGNAYITGEFSGTVAVGGTSLSSAGQTDGYVVKVGPSGAVAWSESFGGTVNDEGMAIAVDPASGSVTIGGQFMNTGAFGTTELASIGAFDAFVAKLDPTGNFVWAGDYGGGGSDGVSALAMDAAGDVSCVGYYAGPAIFDGTILSSIGAQNSFVAAMANNASLPSDGLSSVIGLGGSGLLAKAVRLDAAGNSYVAGYFSGTVDFDPGAAATNLTSHGGYDIYLAKYSPTGALLWAKDFGGSGNDMGNALALDPAGNLYLAGQFSNSMTLGGTTLTAGGGFDAFLAKLNPSGNVTWAAGDGGSGADVATAVALDPAGNVIVAGQFFDSARFGGTTLTSLGSYDVFVAKYTPAGGLSWARSQGGTSVDLVSSLASDGSGNIFLTGSFMGTAGFGGTTLVAGGSYDAYLAKLNSAGTGLWALRLGGSGLDMSQGVATDAAGNAYITGEFSGTVAVGGTSLSSAGQTDGYVVKVGPSGAVAWSESFGGTVNDEGMAIAVDPASGDVTIGGQFMNTGAFGTTQLASIGQFDAFVAQLDPTGNFLWAKGSGGSGSDGVSALAIDAAGGYWAVGYYAGPATFGSHTLANLGSQNIFAVNAIDPKKF